MFFVDMMISNLLYTDFLSIKIKNTIMCDTVDEIQAAQLVMALARARQQRTADKLKEEKLLEAIAQ